MKKTVWVFLITLFLLLAVGVVCGRVSLHAAERMCSLTEEIQSACDEGDLDRAMAQCEKLLDAWEKWETPLQLWTVHEDTDEVAILMRKLRAAIAQKDTLHIAMLCEEMRMSIDHLYHRDAPHVKNIL